MPANPGSGNYYEEMGLSTFAFHGNIVVTPDYRQAGPHQQLVHYSKI
jgi:hypothetical protein